MFNFSNLNVRYKLDKAPVTVISFSGTIQAALEL